VPGFEADDVIATLAHERTGPVEVVTGDRDLFQLIEDAEPTVRVVYLARGFAKAEVLDAGDVTARYGIEPSRYALMALLRGDSSDGLPGAAGIGEKTAAALASRFADLDALLAAAADGTGGGFPAGSAAKVRAAADYLRAADPVVQVRRDVPLPAGFPPPPTTFPVAPDRLAGLATRWGLTTSTTRLVTALRATTAD
jgi:5'-3' exonuclease